MSYPSGNKNKLFSPPFFSIDLIAPKAQSKDMIMIEIIEIKKNKLSLKSNFVSLNL